MNTKTTEGTYVIVHTINGGPRPFEVARIVRSAQGLRPEYSVIPNSYITRALAERELMRLKGMGFTVDEDYGQ